MKLDQRKTGVALTYIHMGMSFLFSLVFTPVILRQLGQSEYGLYNLVASVVSYLGILNFGFGSAYIRYFSRYDLREDEDQLAVLNGIFLLIFALMGALVMTAGFIIAARPEVVFGSRLTPAELVRAKTLIYLMTLNLGLSFPGLVFSAYLTARERFIFQRSLQLVKVVISPFSVLLFLYWGFASVGMALATGLINLSMEVIYVFYCLRRLKMRFRFKRAEPGLMREITVFSSYIFVNLVIDQINWNVDKLIIGRFRGTVQVAVYGVASNFHSYYQRISIAISDVFIPQIHRLATASEDNRPLTRLFTAVGRIQFMVLSAVASFLIFFGKPFIVAWAGAGYADSYPIALLLILPVIIPLIQTMGIEIQRARNLHKFRSLSYFLVALANLLVSIPLTRSYGAKGAAAGTALAMLVGNGLIMNLYNHFGVGLDMRYFWKQILSFIPALLLPLGAGFLISWQVDLARLLNLSVFGFLYLVIFALSFWFLGMNQSEQELIRKPLRRLFRD